MVYTVYKTTNIITGDFYFGVHKTKDPNDKYLGSGKILKKAIVKYGVENFKKEVLFVFSDPQKAFEKEAELVTPDLVEEKQCYNLKVGGEGGFDYLNKNKINTLGVVNRDYKKIAIKIKQTKKQNPRIFSDEEKKRISEAQKGKPKPSVSLALKGKPKSESQKKAISDGLKRSNALKAEMGMKKKKWSEADRANMSINRRGRKHTEKTINLLSSVIWITNGTETKRHSKKEPIPFGWRQGRN